MTGIRRGCLVVVLALVFAGSASARPLRFTGFEVAGPASTFGVGTGDPPSITADGGTTLRPCIALRDDATLDHWFLVTVGHRHAILLQCDWGPAAWTGRAIDITAQGDALLHLDPLNFPTGIEATARELRRR
jgi:hypothetical protein